VAVLVAARGRQADLRELPPRVTFSDRIQNFATERSEAIFAALLAGDAEAQLARLDGHFGAIAGRITAVDLTDGIRMTCASGAVLHLRRSGNAPELRCYSEADDAATAARSTPPRCAWCAKNWPPKKKAPRGWRGLLLGPLSGGTDQ
jgi:phosphomannomutase